LPSRHELIKTNAVRTRVLLADDQPRVLAQVARILGGTCDVVGTVFDGLALVEAAARLHPDVIVSDISMPGVNGLCALRTLKSTGCRSRFVFLTVHEDPDYAREAMSLGADAYVVKSRLASDLLPAIRDAFDGRRFVSPNVL